MITITPAIKIEESELSFEFIRAAGPGGQNVNKVSTAVQLRFDVKNSQSLSEEVKNRLKEIAGSRMSDDGVLIIRAQNHRTQEKNRIEAMARFERLLMQASTNKKKRIPTRPSLSAKAARIGTKKRRGQLKRARRYNAKDWEE